MMRRPDHHHDHNQHQQQSRVLSELSSLILNILRYPPSPAIRFSDHLPSPSPSSSEAPARRRAAYPSQITPAGFASLMLGISLALLLCGSVTFFIGFMLLPWVVGLVMVFYFVGLVSSLSVLGRAFLCCATSSSSPPSPRKDIPESTSLLTLTPNRLTPASTQTNHHPPWVRSGQQRRRIKASVVAALGGSSKTGCDPWLP